MARDNYTDPSAGGGTPTFDAFTFPTATTYAYVLTDTPVTDSEIVILNGVTLTKGPDYTIAGKTVTLNNACTYFVGDMLTIKYGK